MKKLLVAAIVLSFGTGILAGRLFFQRRVIINRIVHDNAGNWTHEPIDVIRAKKQVLDNGSYGAYVRVLKYHMSTGTSSQMLVWSMIMANKHRNAQAFFDAYACFQKLSVGGNELGGLDDLDRKTQTLALDFLAEGAGMGEERAIRAVADYKAAGRYDFHAALH
jgi:hypothetical protein